MKRWAKMQFQPSPPELMPIRPDLPDPEPGSPLPPYRECVDTLQLLATRRSTPVKMLDEPGPSADDLDLILRLAARAPDHRKLGPWRFLIIEGDARQRLGATFATALEKTGAALAPAALEEARALPLRAPVIVTVISSPVQDPKQTPVWEQELSAGAVCLNLLLASFAMGWAASWISEWPAYNTDVASALGLSPGERVAGFIYIGTAIQDLVERPRPDVAERVTHWTGD